MAPGDAAKSNTGTQVFVINDESDLSAVDQIPENHDEKSGDGGALEAENQGLPTIKPAQRRGKSMPVVDENSGLFIIDTNRNTSTQTAPSSKNPITKQNKFTIDTPPLFKSFLQLDPLELKAFQKNLKKHKHSTNMKKLTCLEYFVLRYSEIAYFEVSAVTNGLSGMLGYGNSALVENIRDQFITESTLPSLFGVIAQLESYAGPVMGLRDEDSAGLRALGFTALESLLVLPVTHKKAVTGLWICTAKDAVDLPEKEFAALKKQFTNFVF